MPWFRTAWPFLALLFWFSNSAFSLFELTMARGISSGALTRGNSLPLFEAMEKEKQIDFTSVLENTALFRDTLSFGDLPFGFGLRLEGLFLPGFPVYDEYGLADTILPAAGTVALSWTFSPLDLVVLKLEGWFGGETAGSNWSQSLYGGSISAGIVSNDFFSAAARVSLPQFNTILAESDAAVRFSPLQFSVGLSWNGHTLSSRSRITLFPDGDFSPSAGLAWDFGFGGLEFGASAVIRKIKLFWPDTEITFSLDSSLEGSTRFGAGFAFHPFEEVRAIRLYTAPEGYTARGIVTNAETGALLAFREYFVTVSGPLGTTLAAQPELVLIADGKVIARSYGSRELPCHVVLGHKYPAGKSPAISVRLVLRGAEGRISETRTANLDPDNGIDACEIRVDK